MNTIMVSHLIEALHMMTDEVQQLQIDLRKQKEANGELLRGLRDAGIAAEDTAEAIRVIYMAGRWTTDAVPADEQARLWETLRAAGGIPKGTATAAGVAAE
jgi:hypothetical protein